VVVAVLTAVMLLTIGKKVVRKNLLALTIGLFLHLVFDGAFLNTKMFWWPLTGLSLHGYEIPLVERGLLNIPFEIVGVALIFWTKGRSNPLFQAFKGRLTKHNQYEHLFVNGG